jgi:hypothetical protein
MDAVDYLVSIHHRSFPLKVSTPREIKWVSALIVAGLIEARVEPVPEAKGRLWPAAEATILSVTEEGLVAIREYFAEKRASIGRLFTGDGLPIDYLRDIADGPFPRRVEDEISLKKVLLLKSVGFLEATVYDSRALLNASSNDFALVLRLTPLGQSALRRNGT